jgi:hypothetical protein
MNERIKELLTPKLKEWAGDSDDNFSEELEKFAELIVRECGRVYIQNQQDGVMTLTEDLLYHFGIKK